MPAHKKRRANREALRLPIRQRYGLRFITQEMLSYLTSLQTLEQQAAMSLKERVDAFNLHFNSRLMNYNLLRKIYK